MEEKNISVGRSIMGAPASWVPVAPVRHDRLAVPGCRSLPFIKRKRRTRLL